MKDVLNLIFSSNFTLLSRQKKIILKHEKNLKFKYKFLLITFLLFQTISNQAQILENSQLIDSKILNEKREIKVLLPTNYTSKKKYPIVYITDAKYNFDIASDYLTNLIKYNAIPETILVGIIQKNRQKELDVFWRENGIKFKNFLFREVIPFINNKYNTSGFNSIIGHSDGAEYNHLLMMEKDNPFRGFINISENLNNDVTDKLSKYFRDYKGQKLFYFIASASYDSKDRIEASDFIELSFLQNTNSKIQFLKNTYNADHNSVLSKSLLDGILFLFQDYRNYLNYNNFQGFIEKYQKNIEESLGFIPTLDEKDVGYFFGKILRDKDLEMYEYLIKYVAENNLFEIKTYDRAWHYFHMGQYSQSIKYFNITIENFKNNSPRVFYYNFKKGIDAYLILKNPKGAIAFLEKCKKRLPEYTLEFNYFIAKISFENNVQKRKGKRSLKYCKNNYKENRYFKKEDLNKFKTK